MQNQRAGSALEGFVCGITIASCTTFPKSQQTNGDRSPMSPEEAQDGSHTLVVPTCGTESVVLLLASPASGLRALWPSTLPPTHQPISVRAPSPLLSAPPMTDEAIAEEQEGYG